MRTFLLAAAVAAGFFGGAGTMLVAYPFVFPPAAADDPAPAAAAGARTSPALTSQRPPQQSASALFEFDEMAPGRDPIHWANGSGGFYETELGWVLRLERDFVAGAGPNFWIYLNTVPVGEERAFNADRGRVRIAQLRAFRGAQNYSLRPGIDPTKFHTVTIWCETFGVYIGSGAIVRFGA